MTLLPRVSFMVCMSQQDVYEFVNPDLLLTAHLDSDAPAAECSYWTIMQHRESGRVSKRATACIAASFN